MRQRLRQGEEAEAGAGDREQSRGPGCILAPPDAGEHRKIEEERLDQQSAGGLNARRPALQENRQRRPEGEAEDREVRCLEPPGEHCRGRRGDDQDQEPERGQPNLAGRERQRVRQEQRQQDQAERRRPPGHLRRRSGGRPRPHLSEPRPSGPRRSRIRPCRRDSAQSTDHDLDAHAASIGGAALRYP